MNDELHRNECISNGGGSVARPSAAVISAAEEVFFDWLADNSSALDVGLPGDVYSLFEKLRHVFANASISSCGPNNSSKA